MQKGLRLPLYFVLAGLFELYHTSGDHVRLKMFTGTSSINGRIERGSTLIKDWSKPFCQQWSASDAKNRSLQPFDLWHTHHPNWIVTTENNVEFCVSIANSSNPVVRNMMLFYDNQFNSSCKVVHTRVQWGSGWSADFWNINLGLINGLYHRVPCIMTSWKPDDRLIGTERIYPWNYAANKKDRGKLNQTSLVCEAGDTTCYFLPYQGCGPIDEVKNDSSVKLLEGVEFTKDGSHIWEEMGWSAYSFVTRKQLWVRRAVFDYKEKFRQRGNIKAGSDCTVMHVRRGDVVQDTRHYYPVSFYVDMIPKEKLNDPNHYVFLLTDDSSAISEMYEFFPNIKWMYFDRPRHNGSSSGWQDHTPSGDPALEVIVILAAFDLVQDCSTFVHGPSGFARYIIQYMRRSERHPDLQQYSIHNHPSAERIHKVPLNESEAELQKILEEMRKNKATAPSSVGRETATVGVS